MDEARLRLLKQQIEEAFKDAPYPGDNDMVNNPADGESSDLVEAFKGKHWRELDAETLRRNGSSFLSMAGLQYYFPAYLMAALDNLENILDFTVYGLCLTDPDESPRHAKLREWELKRFNSFTPAQKKAIQAFLEYVRDEYSEYWTHDRSGPARALADYWGRVDSEGA